MKTYLLSAIRYTLILAVSLAIPIGYSYAWDQNDNTDRLSQGSSSIFLPAYVNSAKQRADEVARQSDSQKSWWNSVVENVSNKVSQQINEDANTKVTPELKKKTSAISGSSTNAISLFSGSANQDDIPAYIQNKAQEYINNEGGGGQNCKVKFVNGKYCAVWSSDGFIRSQMFDQNGNALLTTPTSVGYGALDNVIVSSGGNVAVLWQTYTGGYTPGSFGIMLQMIDTNGNAIFTDPRKISGDYVETLQSGSSATTAIALSNGNLAVFWHELNIGPGGGAQFQMLDGSGNSIFSSPKAVELSSNWSLINNVTELSNGNMAVFYNDCESIKVQILDQSGNALPETMPTILGNGYGGWAQIYDIKKLSNGNLAVFWNEPSESTSLNMQIIDESGNTLLREPTAFGGKAFSDIYLFNASVEIFSNGNLAVFWREYNADSGLYHLNMQIADQAGNLISDSPIAISGVSDYSQIADIVSISNGSLAVFFAEYSGSDWEPYVKAQVITPDGNVSFASPTTLGKGLDFFMNMGKINFKSTTLTNGDIAICWYNVVDTSLEVRVFDPTSSTFFTPSSSLTGGDFTSMPVNNLNIAALQDGNFAVFYGTTIYWSDVGLNTQIFDSECNFESITTLKNPLFITSYNNLAIDILPNQYLYTEPDIFKDDLESNYRIFEDISNPDKYYSYKGLSDIFGGLFANKSLFAQGSSVSIDRAALARMVTDSLNEAALSVPISDISRQEMSLAMALASILKDPTDDQKLVLDIVETLLNDMKELKTEKAQNPDLDKTENELMMVVTSYLLAQGIPDLLKEGDISNIRNIFKDFGQSRDKIMLDYRESIKPYYNRMIKELESNLAILQLKGILSKKLTQEELHKFEPKEIDRLTSAIRKANDRSFEMEYILQQEGKYRKEYIDPSNKVLAEAMKKLMKSFAWKLNNALETQKK